VTSTFATQYPFAITCPLSARQRVAKGYRIEYKGHAAVISGDTRYNQNVIKYGTGVDLLIHEVAIARPELMSNLFAQFIIAHHTSPHDAGRVFANAKLKLAASPISSSSAMRMLQKQHRTI
jgi:ribonuclease Z